MLAEINYELAWRKLCRKHGYDPDQPRDELGGGPTPEGTRVEVVKQHGVLSQSVLSDASPDPISAGDQFAKIIPICMLGSHGISTDQWGNKSWRGEYVCADGFTFPGFGNGGRVPPFARDPRR